MEFPKIIQRKHRSEIDIEAIVNIGDDLDVEFRRQAGYYAWISTVYAEAKAKTRFQKAELELFEARLTNSIRENTTGLTVGDVKSRVISDDKYRIKLTELHASQRYEDILQGFVRALDAKRDMLVQLGANSRNELDPELRLLAKKLRVKQS